MSEAYREASNNPLLVKDGTGRAKKSVYDLPRNDHAYGRPDTVDKEGAREVMTKWALHTPRPKPGENVQDYRKMNMVAVGQGVTNSKDLAQFRKKVDLPKVPTPCHAVPSVIPSDVVPGFTYGCKARPSTPIASVVANEFGAACEEASNISYSMYAFDLASRDAKRRVKMTHAASSRIASARAYRRTNEHEVPKEPFKIKKFKNTPSRIGGTLQRLEAHDRAQDVQDSVCPSPASALSIDL